jgi:hypothetical protein
MPDVGNESANTIDFNIEARGLNVAQNQGRHVIPVTKGKSEGQGHQQSLATNLCSMQLKCSNRIDQIILRY